MKVTYTLNYSKNSHQWVIWKNVEGDHSLGCRPVYSSVSKKDCIERLKEINEKRRS